MRRIRLTQRVVDSFHGTTKIENFLRTRKNSTDDITLTNFPRKRDYDNDDDDDYDYDDYDYDDDDDDDDDEDADNEVDEDDVVGCFNSTSSSSHVATPWLPRATLILF
ncbi:hypothetical protein HZH68_012318 [Vespula germanica]|uniref:Uncharacterized protein n=1 Tax=Vespula germanica TaxID=30212 RepID=A0A834JIU3_VESGE|nr:hypothetical protein HZH68_012318 [Vespula germanica]